MAPMQAVAVASFGLSVYIEVHEDCPEVDVKPLPQGGQYVEPSFELYVSAIQGVHGEYPIEL